MAHKPRPKARIQDEDQDLRQRCLQAALISLREGERRFSLRDIARRLGVSHGAPYRHFRSKDDLLMALCDEGFQRFSTALAEGWSSGRTSNDRMTRMGFAYLRFALKNQELYFMMFNEKMSDRHRPALQNISGSSFEMLLSAVAEVLGLDAKNQRVLDQAVLIWSFTHGLAMLMIHEQLEFTGLSPALRIDDFRRISAPLLASFNRDPEQN
jgi:AcrR family transcriptional regulator